MSSISVFDVLGPNMIGPSSSHTAGASSIAYLAWKMAGGNVKSVTFTLYGSFAKTYHGHGTDKALLGGILGFKTDDKRIRDSFKIANDRGVEFEFIVNEEETDIHPNTVDIHAVSADGRVLDVRGESIGGGKCRIVLIDNVPVDFTGEYSAAIVVQKDMPGVIKHIAGALSDRNINIAFMRLFREGKHERAYTIVETDSSLPEDIKDAIMQNKYVEDVMIVQV
ncbi:L-serine ammonia-lyase, iron-sulfur-dependent subunit beta [Pseudobutyrivibrio sp. MD2005]|uniref:L-serine ammonia-lyase, iron-sulfur-dependent subunit beta n=1 Tax=Pseudobutyrivibrio sp. MD2005 TaxID=1410616 RepID=UPI0004876B24|nr:L-serine ammonia-lyase, iron-sulfur-dependent subunit beta [Pseudobutyrivibrio sp. MD2005]